MKTRNMTEDQQYDKIYRTILKHGKAMVIMEERWLYDWHGRRNRQKVVDHVKRVITKDGSSKVAYKGHGYNKYSRYRPSCFVWDYSQGRKNKPKAKKTHWSKNPPKQTMSLRATLRAMREHDQHQNYKIVEIRTGYGFREVVK